MNVQSLAAEGVVVLGVESGIGQDAADWGVSMGSGLPERAAWHSRSRVPAGIDFPSNIIAFLALWGRRDCEFTFNDNDIRNRAL